MPKMIRENKCYFRELKFMMMLNDNLKKTSKLREWPRVLWHKTY